MNGTVVGYVVYLAITLPVTVWVATELSRNGKVFLADVFDDERLAEAVDKLLVVGFYLLNLGFVMLYLRSGGGEGAEQVFATVSRKVGVVMLTLGTLHFLNIYIFNRLRRRQRMEVIQQQRMIAPMAPYPGPMHHPMSPMPPIPTPAAGGRG